MHVSFIIIILLTGLSCINPKFQKFVYPYRIAPALCIRTS